MISLISRQCNLWPVTKPRCIKFIVSDLENSAFPSGVLEILITKNIELSGPLSATTMREAL